MEKKSQWTVRKMSCPEGDCLADLLIEWKVEKGQRVVHSVHCDSLKLRELSGGQCQWACMEKVSPKKAKKSAA